MLLPVIRIFLAVSIAISYLCLPTSYATIISKYFLDVMGVEKHTVLGKEYLDQLRSSGIPFIVAFHHPTFFDHVVLMRELGEFRFVMKKDFAIPVIRQLATKYDVIMVHGKGGTTDIIQQKAIDISKPPIAIAPAGGNVLSDPCQVAPFRSGAFVPLLPIIPVVIRYSPYEYWENGKNLFQTVWTRLQNGVLYYSVQVLPPIIPTKETTISALQEETHQAFQKGLETTPITKPWVPRKNNISLLTSILFILPAVLIYIRGFPMIATSIFLTHFISVNYHLTNHIGIKTVDMFCNAFHGVLYTIYLCYKGFLLPISFLIYAGAFYMIVQGGPEWMHALFVHGPVLLGWSTLVFMDG